MEIDQFWIVDMLCILEHNSLQMCEVQATNSVVVLHCMSQFPLGVLLFHDHEMISLVLVINLFMCRWVSVWANKNKETMNTGARGVPATVKLRQAKKWNTCLYLVWVRGKKTGKDADKWKTVHMKQEPRTCWSKRMWIGLESDVATKSMVKIQCFFTEFKFYLYTK